MESICSVFCEHDVKSKQFFFFTITLFLIIVLTVDLRTIQATSFELQRGCSVKMMWKAAWRCANFALQRAGQKTRQVLFLLLLDSASFVALPVSAEPWESGGWRMGMNKNTWRREGTTLQKINRSMFQRYVRLYCIQYGKHYSANDLSLDLLAILIVRCLRIAVYFRIKTSFLHSSRRHCLNTGVWFGFF